MVAIQNKLYTSAYNFWDSGSPEGNSLDDHVMLSSWNRKSVPSRISTSLPNVKCPSTDSLSSSIIQTSIHLKHKMHQHNLSSVQEVDERVWDEYCSASCKDMQKHTDLDVFSSGETNLSWVVALIIKMRILKREMGIIKSKVYTNVHQHIV